jgi:hypothetical protein
MTRRDFLVLMGGVAAWPLAARDLAGTAASFEKFIPVR